MRFGHRGNLNVLRHKVASARRRRMLDAQGAVWEAEEQVIVANHAPPCFDALSARQIFSSARLPSFWITLEISC